MPPPLPSSLDPFNNPIFSPPYISDSSTISAPSSTFDDAILTTPPRKAIPFKFLAAPQAMSSEHVKSIARSTRMAAGMMTSTIASRSKVRPTAVPDHHMPPPQTPASGSALPEPPSWVIHVLAGMLSFLLVVAVVLLLAQFPPRFTWPAKVERLWRVGYQKVSQEDEYELDGRRHGKSSAVAPEHEKDGNDGRSKSNKLRKRKPSSLSIDTTTHYGGLGIAVPGDKNLQHHLPKRRSFDEEALRVRPRSPAKVVWDSFTAPLPSVKTFTNVSNKLDLNADQDVETGLSSAYTALVSSPEMFDPRLKYYNLNGGSDDEIEPAGSGFFRKINSGIYHVTDELARTFYDQVSGPEEELLLPVREQERERPLTPGVFVE